MTKEIEGRSDVNSDNKVSTSTKCSQNTREKTSVELECSVNNVKEEGCSETLSSEKNKCELLQVEENKFNSDKMDNEVSNDKDPEEAMITKSAENVNEIEEEDVPGDFFDDFLKEDFMEGLDIVDDDAWDEDKIKNETTSDEKPKDVSERKSDKSKKRKQKPTEVSKVSTKIDHVERFITSPPGEKRHKGKKKKHEDKSSEQKPKKSKDAVIDADEFDIRRDPEKTKRDIEKDKARCEKDKEKKIISEKLSLVETGLVPPGMEMEIDIEEVKRQKEKIEQNKPPRDLRERLKCLRSRSKSLTRKQRSPKITTTSRKSVSPSKRSSLKKRRTRSPIRGRSPGRVSPIRRSPFRRSPLNTSVRRSPVRKNSPRRSPLRSPLHRPGEQSYREEKRSLRRSRSHSPYYRSRHTRYSPLRHRRRGRSNSRESERELWLKRRRSRSRSPRSKRQEKKSFLQEIAEKLNETRPQPVNIMPTLQPQMHFVAAQPIQAAPVPVPAPAPVPPPANSYFTPQPQSRLEQQSQQPYDPYDQSFFIGTPQPLSGPNFVRQVRSMSGIGLPQPHKIIIKPISAIQLPISAPQTPVIPTSTGVNNIPRSLENSIPQSQERIKGDTKEMTRLFQDKKITLSEFLAITAKPEVASSSPALIQEKIKVIQRCQEAIKILGANEKKYTGKLIVHRTDNYKVEEQNNKSPLIRTPPVVFPFTQHQKTREQKMTFTNFVNHLLQKIGVMKEAVVDVDKETSPSPGIATAVRKLSPPPPPPFNKNSSSIESKPNTRSYMFGNNQLSKLVQTDFAKCESCEKRKKILYKTSAVQCGGDLIKFSVSTQVTESDFYSKIPITQSLASLTPAQLLAKSRAGLDSLTPSKFGRGIDKDDFDISLTKSNFTTRSSFPRSTDNYNLSRYSPPIHEEVSPSTYNNLTLSRTQFIGGGGRGRAPQANPSRPLAPNRFAYNNYF